MRLSRIRHIICIIVGAVVMYSTSYAQQSYELKEGWKCKKAITIDALGTEISQPDTPITNWMPAIVPGTVLTTLLYNKLIPDLFYGLNNELIPDIYKTGSNEYTYWFVKDFEEYAKDSGEHVWLQFRGINYGADIFLNGHHLNGSGELKTEGVPTTTPQQDKGMFLRQEYDISPYMMPSGHNRLAVIVYPPYPPGNPNGGQGGDGMIAHSITNQYAAGWDWIQPIRDRNTGIWDKVFLRKTREVTVTNTHVVTYVPGKRYPDSAQAPVRIKVTTEVENTDLKHDISGTLVCELEGRKITMKVTAGKGEMTIIEFPEIFVDSPRLWWPNGYGKPELYKLKVSFLTDKNNVSDFEDITFGIRELKTSWNKKTQSSELHVNGQRIFIKGGNRILSDEMLRFTPARYDAEMRYHRDMNLNLIRVWGGGITERPEFYDACDRYGLLVMQDFWASGDCNGRWDDPMKLEDTNARRQYPDDHRLFICSLEDNIKMLRNHPSMAFWCGGNEISPPADILAALRDTLLPELDGTRFLFSNSNDDSMSLHGGDGPYTIQPLSYFWEHQSFPFNSEIGSVGIGDSVSLARFLPSAYMNPPYYDTGKRNWIVDTVWKYHKYIGYDSAIEVYGHPTGMADFANKAQLVNYDQYRALIEGATAHMWDWYTGIIIWKTQNPWTAMLGQMYDVYLDPNACLYGVQEGSKPIHVMYNPVQKTILAVNNGFTATAPLRLRASVYDMQGNETLLGRDTLISIPHSSSKTYKNVAKQIDNLCNKEGCFVSLCMYDTATNALIDENNYWLPASSGNYTGLQHMPPAKLKTTLTTIEIGNNRITLTNPHGEPVAFFIHLSLTDRATGERILPVFYEDNYISVLPAQSRTIDVHYLPEAGVEPVLTIEGWNVEKRVIGE